MTKRTILHTSHPTDYNTDGEWTNTAIGPDSIATTDEGLPGFPGGSAHIINPTGEYRAPGYAWVNEQCVGWFARQIDGDDYVFETGDTVRLSIWFKYELQDIQPPVEDPPWEYMEEFTYIIKLSWDGPTAFDLVMKTDAEGLKTLYAQTFVPPGPGATVGGVFMPVAPGVWHNSLCELGPIGPAATLSWYLDGKLVETLPPFDTTLIPGGSQALLEMTALTRGNWSIYREADQNVELIYPGTETWFDEIHLSVNEPFVFEHQMQPGVGVPNLVSPGGRHMVPRRTVNVL